MTPRPGDALLVVDVQHDFLPGGSLGVAGADAIVPVLNRYLDLWRARGLPVFASRCWHPPAHCSFRAEGGPWPSHCVAGSPGARFAVALALPEGATVVAKGTAPDRDAYSAFDGTALAARLADAGIRRLFIGGLTTDYCVVSTVRDAVARGYEVVVLEDAIRAVDREPGDGARAEAEMRRLGARFIRHETLAA
jgi:nicotinamidase/pyrazinamidase